MLSHAATNAVITDPMGDMFSIPGITSENYGSLIDVSHGTISWNDETETITWNLGTVSEGTTYTMSYTVEIDGKFLRYLLDEVNKLNSDIKWEVQVKPIIELKLLSLSREA